SVYVLKQTYKLAVRIQDMYKHYATIAKTDKNTVHDFLFTDTLMEAITSDTGWSNGEYTSHTDVKEGLKRHADIWAVMGLSTEFYKQEKWKMFNVKTVEAFREEFL